MLPKYGDNFLPLRARRAIRLGIEFLHILVIGTLAFLAFVFWRIDVFNIGQEVISKKLGVPAVGRVAGYVEGRVWYNINLENPGCVSAFERVYPEWKDKPVYYLEFSSEIKPLSMEQYEEEQQAGNSFCECAYEDLPGGRIFVYPEADLEIFEFAW